jgi:Protein of unknown function (DUF4089)
MIRKMSRKRKKARSAKPASPPGKARAPAAAKRTDVIETLVAASAHALALPIDPAWRAGVQRNLQLILTHAAIVEQFSLPDEIEPAPVFRA